MIRKNAELKTAMYLTGKSQGQIAKEVGMAESHLSMVCSGRLNLSEDQQVRLANACGLPVEKIFPGQQ